MSTLSVLTLVVRAGADALFDAMLGVGRVVGLPVDTWRAGDPTRAQFRGVAELVDTLDSVQVELAKSAFLSTAEAEWLTLRAQDVYDVERSAAEFAAPSVTFDNAGGGLFVFEPGGLVVGSTTSQSTYSNQATLQIDPLTSDIVGLFIAQQAGASGSVVADSIDTIVSPPLPGVTITASSAALGADEQSDPGLREQCIASLGALSPDGPADAYEYVAGNVELTGVAGITRRKAVGDNETGEVTVYIAATAAAVDGATVTAVQAAIDVYATPLCTLATVVAASARSIAVTLTGVDSDEQDFLETVLTAHLASVELGALVARDAIASAVRVALADAGRPVAGAIGVTLPATDDTLDPDEFPILGALVLA